MTLIAGLVGSHCGVMLADSQETIVGYAKKSVYKLSYGVTKSNVRFVMGGASDSGPYIDRFNSELTETLSEMQSEVIVGTQLP